jgi:hypothetical protein
MHEPSLMSWSMKVERDVVQLAASDLSVDQIATKLKIRPKALIKMGRRLGIRFHPLKLKRNGRRGAK